MFNLPQACRSLLHLAALIALVVSSHAAEKRVVAYVPNWIDLESFAERIDYGKVTHLNVAFENPEDDQGKLSFKDQNRAVIRNAKKNGVKILVSLGGGAASADPALLARYRRLLASDRREPFAKAIAAYVETRGFDGVDVDLEGPAINEDYAPFITALAEALKPKERLLTCALSKGYGGEKVNPDTLGHFDFVNVMAYDASGPWMPGSPGPHSSLEFARENVKFWLGKGLPKSKVVLGVPFYGYGFGKAFRRQEYAYAQIVAAHPGAEKTDHTGEIWYNGTPTIQAKVQYVKDEELGGVMIWSLEKDAPGKHSLLSVIHESLNNSVRSPSPAVPR